MPGIYKPRYCSCCLEEVFLAIGGEHLFPSAQDVGLEAGSPKGIVRLCRICHEEGRFDKLEEL